MHIFKKGSAYGNNEKKSNHLGAFFSLFGH
jgi:hypothetical protein